MPSSPMPAYHAQVHAPPTSCLNYVIIVCLFSLTAIEVAEDLRKYILEIYGDYLSPDGFVSQLFVILCVLVYSICVLSVHSIQTTH